MKQALNDAIAMRGGMALFSSLIGESPQTISNWRVRGVPIKHAVAIERLTDRRVMRWDLRPQDWHDIWPELAVIEGAPMPPISATADAAVVEIAQQAQALGDVVDGREERAAA